MSQITFRVPSYPAQEDGSPKEEPENAHRERTANFVEPQLSAIEKSLELDPDKAKLKLRSALITAGTMWILVNGSNLFTEMVQCPKEINTKVLDDKILATGSIFDGDNYGIERWTFWRRGFGVAARGEGVDAKFAELATKAVTVMKALEQGMWH